MGYQMTTKAEDCKVIKLGKGAEMIWRFQVNRIILTFAPESLILSYGCMLMVCVLIAKAIWLIESTYQMHRDM